MLLVDILIIQSTVNFTRGIIGIEFHILTFDHILYMLVSVVVREDPFQNGVAHIIQACTDHVGHCGHVAHVMDVDPPFAQISQAGHVAHMAHTDHVGHCGHVVHVVHGNQFIQFAQVFHWGHVAHVAHGNQLIQLVQEAHVAHCGHVGQAGHCGHGNCVDQSIKVFNTKIISHPLFIHNIFSTPVKSFASSQDKLSVYNLILVHVFISNNLVASLSFQSMDKIILCIVWIELFSSVNIGGIKANTKIDQSQIIILEKIIIRLLSLTFCFDQILLLLNFEFFII